MAAEPRDDHVSGLKVAGQSGGYRSSSLDSACVKARDRISSVALMATTRSTTMSATRMDSLFVELGDEMVELLELVAVIGRGGDSWHRCSLKC
jgi:hypothetical protein